MLYFRQETGGVMSFVMENMYGNFTWKVKPTTVNYFIIKSINCAKMEINCISQAIISESFSQYKSFLL